MSIFDSLISFIETIVPYLLMFTILVGVHEYGHYRVARARGILATQFSIGFGKVLWTVTDADGCEWQIRMIPLGGYVRFLGDLDQASGLKESGLDVAAPTMSPEERRKYLQLRSPQDRILVMLAGPVSNLVFGLFILAALYSGFGRPVVPPVVQSVIAGGPAEKAGIMPGDRFMSVNGVKVNTFEDLFTEISLRPNEMITAVIHRGQGEAAVERQFQIKPRLVIIETLGMKQSISRIGIKSGETAIVQVGPIDAVVLGAHDVWKQSRAMLITVGQLFSGSRSIEEVGGPVKMAEMSGAAAKAGLATFVFMTAVFSVNLGIVNLLPIPVLDGGQIVVCLLEILFRRPVDQRYLMYLQTGGAAVLLTLMLVLTVNDIWSIISRTILLR